MKRTGFFAAILIAVWSLPLLADWVTDKEFNFKIEVPNSWQKNRFDDGSDRVHTFVSPDENLAVRIRAFAVNERVTLDLIASLFRSKILGECEQLTLMDQTVNGYEGKIGAYRGVYNGTKVGAGVFYTIQNGIAYIVWSLTPVDLFQSKIAESDAITNTFTIIGDRAGAAAGGEPSPAGPELSNVFEDAGLGYSIRYPGDWVYTKSKPYIVIFSGREGTPAYYATVTIQNLASTLSGGNFNTVDDVIAHFRKQLESGARDASMSTPEPFSVQADGKTMSGKVYTVTYTRQNARFKQRMVIFARFDMQLFYAFIYTASVADYDTYYPIARAMLESWNIR